MKNILVTGYRGYLGSALLKKLNEIADYNLLYSFMFMGIIILANTLLFRVNNKHLNNS